MRAGRRDREGALDSLILGLAIAVVLRQLLISADQHSTAMPPGLVIALTLIAGLTVAAGMRLIFLAPGAPSAWLLFGAAVFGQVIGVLMALANGAGGQIPTQAYVVAGLTRLLVGAAALHPSMAVLTRPDERRPGMPYGRLVVLCTALPACVLAVFIEAGAGMATSFAGIGVLAVAVLVLVRLASLLMEREGVRRLQEHTVRIGAQAFDETDEELLLQRAADALAGALDAVVLVRTATVLVQAPHGHPHDVDDTAMQVPLGGGIGGSITVSRARPFTPDERNCADTVGVILTGALRRGRSEAAVRHAAVHDALTGLPNRELLVDRLEQALAKEEPGRVALLFIDLDGFKAVNDRLGHLAGDRVLVEAADRMRRAVRADDLLARFAGDEFVVLTTPESDVQRLAERLRAGMAEPFHLDVGTATIGASVGVAVHDGAETAEQLLRRADVAMYAVKRGRRRVDVPADIGTALPAG
jgi:diguanylate cyclase (GGDEF)-like protein